MYLNFLDDTHVGWDVTLSRTFDWFLGLGQDQKNIEGVSHTGISALWDRSHD